MKAKDFESIAGGWSDKLVWDKTELKKIGSLLFALCKANGGEIANDTEPGEGVSRTFIMRQVEDALTRRVSLYAKVLREAVTPVCTQPLAKKSRYLIPGLVSHEWIQRVNINTDDMEVLCRLPAMDRKVAQEIIKHRKKNGRFSAVEQLAGVKGIKEDTVAALKYQAFCRLEESKNSITDELNAFMKKPTFGNYVESISGKKSAVLWSTGTNEDAKKHILAELEKALDDVKKNGFGVARNLRYTRASNVTKYDKYRSKAAEISNSKTENTDCGALLYDGQYHPFVKELLGAAKKSITVMMFFMRYEEGKVYVVNPLIERLVGAHKAGLDVRIILDKDAEDDTIGSRLVNVEAFEMLTKNNVPVFYDTEGRMTHSKLVVIDGEHVVVGSHNWTAGSFLSYNDTSVYVASTELAVKYENIVSNFLTEYNKA